MSFDKPLVSVILPVYNVEVYLEECLESLKKQSYKEIEIIAINDGSTDKSLLILELFKKKYDKLKIINQRNKGLSEARNTGLNFINGKYLYFLDSDDYIESDMFENLVRSSERYNADIVRFCSKSFADNNYNNQINDNYINRNSFKVNEVYSMSKFLSITRKSKDFGPPVWLYFFKSSLIIDNDLKFEKGLLHEDELFTPIVLGYAERIIYDPQQYFNRRFRNDSIMTSNVLKSKKSYYAKKEVINKLDQHKLKVSSKELKRFINWRIDSIFQVLLIYQLENKYLNLMHFHKINRFKRYRYCIERLIKNSIKKTLKLG